jgi:hypothetical protein
VSWIVYVDAVDEREVSNGSRRKIYDQVDVFLDLQRITNLTRVLIEFQQHSRFHVLFLLLGLATPSTG